jgi:aerobic carbon-monoxide dehydrogenase large subunit
MSETLARPATLVGSRVPRVNDPKLLTGACRFVDDIQLPGLVHAAVLRSPVAHGRLASVDVSPAAEDPDVLAVLTPHEVAQATRPVPCVWVLPGQRQTSYPVVPTDVTRYLGEPLGLVVATSRAAAEDARELIVIDVDELPAVADPDAAVGEDAPLLHPAWGTNVVVDMPRGDPEDAVTAAVEGSPHVVSLRFRIQRLSGNPIETRGLVARWDARTEELTVWLSTQVPHHARDHLAETLGLRYDAVRVIAPDVGGGFGTKDHVYPDEIIVCLASMRLERPVKWIEDRSESFLASVQSREQVHEARLAFEDDGRFVALQTDLLGDIGAHPSNVGAGPAFVATGMLEGPYRFDSAGGRLRCVLTNKTPTGAYRGFGMQQAAWVRERLVDEAARKLGIDPAELRRRNMIRADELPHTTHHLQNYDSGDYVGALDRAVELIRAEQPQVDDGRRRGVGLSSYVEFTGLGPSRVQQLVNFRLGGYETAVVRIESDGTATVLTGVCSHGQGLETSLAQVAADQLGLPLEDVKIVFGDTATAPYSSTGTIASRSMAVGGGAVLRASRRVRDKLQAAAAHMLEVSPEDLEVQERMFRVRGVPTSGISVREVADKVRLGWDLPEGMDPGLEERELHDPADISYSYATHAAAIAVDLEMGEIEIEDYVVVHDCGVIVNPMIVDGQIHGGVAQGLGGALLEEMVYDPDGNPLTATFMDYLLPTSGEVPDIVVEHTEVPSPFIPGGMKGMGEGGTIAPAAAIGNALADAVPEIADLVTETPLSPSKVWTWISERIGRES